MFHIGKVLFIFDPKDKEIISADNSVQATIKMWDKNIVTAGIEDSLGDKLKKSDIVLIDYSPQRGTGVPRIIVTKILKGKIAKDTFKEYEDYYEEKTSAKSNKIALPFPSKQIT